MSELAIDWLSPRRRVGVGHDKRIARLVGSTSVLHWRKVDVRLLERILHSPFLSG